MTQTARTLALLMCMALVTTAWLSSTATAEDDEVAKLKKQLAAEQERYAADVSALHQQLAEMESRLGAVQSEYAKARSNLTELERRRSLEQRETAETTTQLETHLAQMTTDYYDAMLGKTQAQEQCALLEAQLADTREQYATDINAVQSQLAEIHERANHLSVEKTQLENERAMLRDIDARRREALIEMLRGAINLLEGR